MNSIDKHKRNGFHIADSKNLVTRIYKNLIGNLLACFCYQINDNRIATFSILLMLAFVNSIFAQSSITPAGNAPGRPAGSYLLSDIESVNLYSGKLNAVVPLIKVGGRGQAGYQMVYPFKPAQWTTYQDIYQSDGQQWLSINAVSHPDEIPNQNRTVFLRPFEFGTVSIRYSGIIPGCPYQGNADYPSCFLNASIVVVFTSADGTEHPLWDEKRGGSATANNALYPNEVWFPERDRGLVFSAKDGSEWTFVGDPETPGSTDYYAKTDMDFYPLPNSSAQSGFKEVPANGYLKNNDGTVIRFDGARAQWIQDRNGNKTTFIYESGGQHLLDKVIDANNRETDIVYGSGYQQVVYPGTGGQSRTITISQASLQSRLPAGNIIHQIYGLFPAYPQQNSPYTFDNGNATFNPQVASTITLPDNRAYGFYYNSYGEIARLESPNGAAIEYSYGAGVANAFPSGQFGGIYRGPGEPTSSSSVAIYRRLVERREYPNGGSAATLKTTYSLYADTGKVREDQIDVSTAQVLTRKDHFYYGNPTDFLYPGSSGIGFSADRSGREYKTESLDVSNNTVLTQTEDQWNDGCIVSRITCGTNNNPTPWSPFIEQTTASIYNSSINQYQVTKKAFSYDKYNSLTDTYEYDFGDGSAGTFLRRSHTDYVTDTNYTSETGPHLRRLPLQSWMASDINGNNKASLINFEYDNYSGGSNAALQDRANVTGHNTTGFGTAKTIRGNLTSVKAYANVRKSSSAITTYLHYDILGNVVETIDAKGNHSTISYNDNFGSPDGEARTPMVPDQISGLGTYAFPTSATNALNWVMGYSQFDYYTGQAVDAEDINGAVSTMFYIDPLDRPTQAIAANNLSGFRQQTTTTYSDDVSSRKVTTTGDLFTFGDNLSKSESLYDGLGRTTETRKYEASGGYVAVQTQYDALGRAYKTTNPFRPSEINANNPIRWTESKFDSLGRAYETETPDGAKVLIGYSGNAVTVTDQAGKQRRSITNALGQLKRVDEPNADDGQFGTVDAPNQPTSYDYDALNNLKTVTQGVQTRSFVYDNLSRLTSATNPELGNTVNGTYVPGTISYTYDANGNLQTKLDPRGIKTIYDYDELNRVKNRCYRVVGSGALGATSCADEIGETPEPNTPAVGYTYDDTNVLFSKGRLTKVTTGNPANPLSITAYTEFDNLGRVKQSQQTTDNVAYDPMSYSYYLSGALMTETYPSGRVVKNLLDNNGDLATVQSKKTPGGSFSDYARLFTYTAAGAVSSMQLGNNLWESTVFNSRLQPTQIALGTLQNGTDNLKLNFSYNSPTSTTDNNGNAISQKIAVPAIGTNAAYTATQNYTYDSLNRLKSADETIPGQTGWQQTYKYDRYGNRQFDTAVNNSVSYNGSITDLSNCPTNVCNPTPDTANNRLNGYSYDNAGNTTRDAQSRKFTYDAENKQTKAETVDANGSVTSTIGEYSYDGDGKRVKKYVPSTGETTIFVYDASGKMVAEYSTVVASAANAKVSYLTSDHLGSPRITTDANGAVTSRRDFMPFGEEVQRSSYGTDTVRQKFTSYERDIESNLDFAQARYYGYSYGRFTSPDKPLLDQSSSYPQSWNLYVYAGNSPLKYTDPLGLWKKVDCEGGSTQCWEAEEGDTLDSFAEKLGVSSKNLNEFFQNQEVVEGRVFDVSEYQNWLKGDMQRGMNDVVERWSRVEPPMGGGLKIVGKAGKASGLFGWIGRQAGRAGRWAGILSKAKVASVAELAAKQLVGSSGREMIRDAVNIVKSFKGSPAEKAELLESFIKQIAQRTGGSWNAARNTAVDGATIFAGEYGETLVVTATGEVFKGNYNQGAWKFTTEGYKVFYEAMKKID